MGKYPFQYEGCAIRTKRTDVYRGDAYMGLLSRRRKYASLHVIMMFVQLYRLGLLVVPLVNLSASLLEMSNLLVETHICVSEVHLQHLRRGTGPTHRTVTYIFILSANKLIIG